MVRSCHACVNLSRLRSSGFMLTLRSGSSLSPMRQRAGHIACTKLPVGLPEIFICAHLKFTVYGRKHADIHTHNFRKCGHASVGLAQARPNHVRFDLALFVLLYCLALPAYRPSHALTAYMKIFLQAFTARLKVWAIKRKVG